MASAPEPGGGSRTLARLVFGVYAWCALAVIAPPCVLLIALVRRVGTRWAVVWRGGRLFLRVVPIRVRVHGTVPSRRPLVLACNHSSMLDGLAMVLALPGPQSFVVNGRFASVPFLGRLLRRLGAVFVHRPHQPLLAGAHADVDHLAGRLDRGDLLVVFPEGSLGAHPGVRPFHHGAFAAAARIPAPVVPVAIRGTRQMMAPGRRLPRRTDVDVVVGEPIDPTGDAWEDVVALAEVVRDEVARLADEPEIPSDPYRADGPRRRRGSHTDGP